MVFTLQCFSLWRVLLFRNILPWLYFSSFVSKTNIYICVSPSFFKHPFPLFHYFLARIVFPYPTSIFSSSLFPKLRQLRWRRRPHSRHVAGTEDPRSARTSPLHGRHGRGNWRRAKEDGAGPVHGRVCEKQNGNVLPRYAEESEARGKLRRLRSKHDG